MFSGGHSPVSDGTVSAGRRLREWFLLNGHRLHVLGVTVLVLFLAVSAIGISPVAPLQNLQPLYYVFGGLISGNLTVITVVVSINQLLLSRELSSPSELQEQMDGVISYREDIEQIAGRVSPVDPSGFLRLLVESTRQEAQTLGGLSRFEASEAVDAEIDPVVTKLTDEADSVDALLQKPDATTFEALSTLLTTNYAKQINQLRRIESRHEGELPDDVEEALENLVHHLKDIDVARQYFKTIYLQEELATLSRLLFYVGFVSLVTVTGGLFVFTASTGTSVQPQILPVVVAGVVTGGLLPISLLFTFILRVSTVTQRTAATLPFTTPEQEL